VKAVLLVRAGALGDVLLLRVAVNALRRAGVQVGLMAPAPSGRVLVGPGLSEVDRLIVWDRPDVARLFGDASALGPALRGELASFDLAIAYTREIALVDGLAKHLPRVLGWDPTPPRGAHAASWLARPVASLGFEVEANPPPCLPVDEERAAVAGMLRELPRAFLALHPGSGSAAKNWPTAAFGALVERIAPGERWLLVEGPADAAAARNLERLPGALLARQLPERQLGALFSRSGLYVGNDSGVSHLAAAFGAPVVALFGPTDPALWSPVGSRVHALRSPTTRMQDLGLEDAVSACQVLRSGAAAPRGC
jgi:heptosyltransferase-3